MDAIYVLVGEDDADDRFLLKSAFEENGFTGRLVFKENGVEVMNFLQDIDYESGKGAMPAFILLDLNMPKKDGREVLKEIRQVPAYQNTPIVILSTTNNEKEMSRCYELGANAYVTKPNSFDQLIRTIHMLKNYWA